MVWQFGIGIGLIILCLVGAWFSPLFKKDFLYAAVVIAVALFFETVGIKAEKARRDAQDQVITQTVNEAVAKSKTPEGRKQNDPYDNPKF